MKISKELFEAVMNDDNIKFIGILRRVFIEYKYIDSGNTDKIHINHFFFKCKKWANRLGYDLSTHSSFEKHYCGIHEMGQQDPEYCLSEYDTEQQAVFDACQWILENKSA